MARNRERNRSVRMLLVALVVTLAIPAAGCRPGVPALQTRTFSLSYLKPSRAESIIQPYVYSARPGAPGTMSVFDGGLTVRETPDNLDRIAAVLKQYDRPAPNVRFHFQLIEADGASAPDPRIASLDSLLKGLFRYRGYRLLDEVPLTVADGGQTSTRVRADGRSLMIYVVLDRVRAGPQGGEADLRVHLADAPGAPAILSTSLTVPLGKTVVLGSSQLARDEGALIVAVRPELLPADSASGGS